MKWIMKMKTKEEEGEGRRYGIGSILDEHTVRCYVQPLRWRFHLFGDRLHFLNYHHRRY